MARIFVDTNVLFPISLMDMMYGSLHCIYHPLACRQVVSD